MKKTYEKKGFREGLWLRLYKLALKQGLKGKELVILKQFFTQLPSANIEDIIFNQKIFKKKLLDYFNEHSEFSLNAEVNALDKLFPEIEVPIGISSLADLHHGEICGVDIEGNHYLATILKFNDQEVLLGAGKHQFDPLLKAKKTSLYLFRPSFGGFQILGTTVKANKTGLLFKSNGIIKKTQQIHLMAYLELTFMIKLAKVSKDFKHNPKDQENYNESYTCDSLKISDRAILFKFQTSLTPNKQIINSDNIFEITLELPDGFSIHCHGKILPSTKKNYYIFKFLDISQVQREVLFAEIKQHGAYREQLN